MNRPDLGRPATPSSLWRAGALAILTSALLVGATAAAEPVISEFLANNGATLDDEDGDSSDWIELYNPGPGQVDLGGYALSDDPALPSKWQFPPGQFLGDGAHLIVFASGKARRDLGREYHTNFELDADGEYLALRGPGGALLQSFAPKYPRQRRDVSYGVGSDGMEGFFDPPTPNAANGTPFTGFVSDTVFSHKRGFYNAPFSVSIASATPNVAIRFTTDGSKPSATLGTLYTGPIEIDRTTVLRALAFKPGMVPTNIDAQSYLFPADILRHPDMNPTILNSPLYRSELLDSVRALPVVSLSFRDNDLFGFTGIHRNPDLRGRRSEREIHFEFFDPDNPSDSTHEPAGVRIHGGNSRVHPKKNFRLYFRSDYGDPRLEHDLFPPSPVKRFKRLLLRGGGHDAWTFRDDWDQASYIRNEFLHRVQLAMGQPSPRGRFVSLFLNGAYWGVYELQELPHEHFNADHHGGDPDDWDVIKHGSVVEAGTADAWTDLLDRARAGIESDDAYESIQEYIDVDHFADAMIHRIWASDEDWLSPAFRGPVDISPFTDDKNWYVGRKSRNGTSKFYFYCWDAEMSMGIPFAAPRSYLSDFTRVDNDNSPGIIYDRLRRHPEFQLRFADRLHKHFFNGGAFTVPRLEELWDPLVGAVRTPMVAESARWGLKSWTDNRSIPYTRDGQWLPATDWIRSQFIANRSKVVLSQFQQVELYPATAAPVASPSISSSAVPLEIALATTTDNATIYFTTDGSDPREVPDSSSLDLITVDHPVQVVVPDFALDREIGESWKELDDPTNIASWTIGVNGVGYEGFSGGFPDYRDFIQTPLANMQNENSSVYLRYNFRIENKSELEAITQLLLRVRYDDGFIAYLNGEEVESVNTISTAWNASASAVHDDTEAIVFEEFDLQASLRHLRLGENVLALHGQNRSAANVDFLIQAILTAATGDLNGPVSANAWQYDGPFVLDETTQLRARARSASGEWSALNDVTYKIGRPASSDNLTISEIHYHPLDPSTGNERDVSGNDNDFEFLELLNTSSGSIDLSHCTFAAGIDFAFPEGSFLAPGSRLVLVSNPVAFRARYGENADPFVSGEFENGTQLANGGERITLNDPAGKTIFDFRYDDAPPWPAEPDGGGSSLVLADPFATSPAELGEADRWRSSDDVHGTPGLPESMSFDRWAHLQYGPRDSIDPEIAGDLVVPPGQPGLSNIQLYAQGQEINGALAPELSTFGSADFDGQPYLTLTYQLRTGLDDVIVTPELSSDLLTWEASFEEVSRRAMPDGLTAVTVRDLLPLTESPARFIRLRFARRN